MPRNRLLNGGFRCQGTLRDFLQRALEAVGQYTLLLGHEVRRREEELMGSRDAGFVKEDWRLQYYAEGRSSLRKRLEVLQRRYVLLDECRRRNG